MNHTEGMKIAVDNPNPSAILKMSDFGLLVFCRDAVLFSNESSNVDDNIEEEKELR